jgi:hypothetical protein
MSSVKIDQALLQAFIDASFGLDIAHENLPFTPGSDAYAEVLILQNDTTPWSLKHSNETDGILRIILRYPADTGAIAAKQKAEEIFNVFKIGSRHVYDGATVTITSNQRARGVQETGWYKLVLSMQYKAYLKR